jgi:hypothetical protein
VPQAVAEVEQVDAVVARQRLAILAEVWAEGSNPFARSRFPQEISA